MTLKVLSLILLIFIIRLFSIGLDSKIVGYGLVVIFSLSLVGYSVVNHNKLECFLSSKLARVFSYFFLISFLSCICAMFYGLPIIDSALALSKLIIIFLILFFSYLCGMSSRALLYFKVVIFCLFIHVLLGIVLKPLGFVEEIHGATRLLGLTGGVQVFANIAMLLFVYSTVSVILKDYKMFSLPLLILFVVVSLLAMVMSNTLKNFAAALLTISFLFLVDFRKAMKWLIPLGVVFIISIPLLYSWFMESEIYGRLLIVWEAGIKTELEPGEKLESSLVWRFIHWSKLFNDWGQNYYVTGAGFGQITNINGLKTPDGRGYEAHSDLVTIILEFGLVFVLPILYCFYLLFSLPLKLYNTTHLKVFRVMYLCGLSLIISSSFGNVFYSLACMYFFWFFVGWSEGYAKRLHHINQFS
jgi:hypothetical protein